MPTLQHAPTRFAAPPTARGPLSSRVLDLLAGAATTPPSEEAFRGSDALADDDLQLALYLCYQQHFTGWPYGDARSEWDAELIRVRTDLEREFERSLRVALLERPSPTGEVAEVICRLVDEDDGPSVSQHMEGSGTLEQMREFVVHRSAYQLKEGDGHTFAIPRLAGAAKQALVHIQAGEYGTERPGQEMHASLFAATMSEFGLDPTPNGYVDLLPASTLATDNLVSFLGLHRARRGALVGHLTVVEMTSVVPMGRYSRALRRLGVSERARRFYDVHVLADAEHERMALRDMAAQLARDEPELCDDIVFGARAVIELECRFAEHILQSWACGVTSLRAPLAG